MTPLRSTRRALASSASLFVPGPPSPGTGCMLCLWKSGRNEFKPVVVPEAGACDTITFTPMSVSWMISRGASVMPHLGPHPGHLSLAVSQPDDPTAVKYLSLGAVNLDKSTALSSATPVLSDKLSTDIVTFRRMPDQILHINFVDQQPVYDWICSFQENIPTKKYHMLGIAGYSCATSCREALMAGTVNTDIFRRTLPINAFITPQWVFNQALRLQEGVNIAQDSSFMEKQLQEAVILHKQQATAVNEKLKSIIDMLKSNRLTATNLDTYNNAQKWYLEILPLFIGRHPEFQHLPLYQPKQAQVALISALETILKRESHLASELGKNYVDQIRILTYNKNQSGATPGY